MRIKTRYKEQETFDVLKERFPDIRRHGANQALREAYEWVQGYGEIRDGDTEELKADMRPPICPDGTRLIKLEATNCGAFGKRPEMYRDFIIQFWEIENTYPVSEYKIDRLEKWLFFKLDPYDVGNFELWRCDKWGGGHRMLMSTIDWFPYSNLYHYNQLPTWKQTPTIEGVNQN
jgi:hypothetical protein